MVNVTSPKFIWIRSVAEVGYVTMIAILAIVATSDLNNLRQWALIASFVLCLPSMLIVLPVFYLAVSTAFNVTGADSRGTTWPVTATYVAVFALAAVMNVWLASLAIKSRQRQRNAETSVS